MGTCVMTCPNSSALGLAGRGWSYPDLERRSGRALSGGRWQQLGSGVGQKKFPGPASLTLIAGELDITTIVLAAAHTVGWDVQHAGGGLTHRLPPGTERPSDRTRDAILTLICAAVEHTANDGSSTDLEDGSGMRLEWLKSGHPSLQHGNGVTKDVKQ